MNLSLISFIIGFTADLLLGDPLGSFHIVVAIGKLISFLEKNLRRVFPKTPRGELAGGFLTVLAVCVLSFALTRQLLFFCYSIHWIPGLLLESFLCWQCLAARALCKESMTVYRALKSNHLTAARTLLSRIVGRETQSLKEDEVSRACVETIAENCSDGVMAPLLYLALGVPFGVLYKAINTMDSMLGYKNKRYFYFGKAAARLDDIVNYVPARLSALIIIAAAPLCLLDGGNARRIFFRDRRNHTSPNSAHTEAAFAGALHIRLGGPSSYFGKVVPKPYIGDEDRPVVFEDIRLANRLMLVGSMLFFLFTVLGKGIFLLC
ncbi:MAG: cobalamin biosynthesis protein CobD [Lachnospiraceae bacterium]|nr:cobalamin biosynthesis protein CobD [Lachnospiraceae bacterium]